MKFFFFHYNYQPHWSTLPKIGKYFTTIAGQSGRSRHCCWLTFMSHAQQVPSPQGVLAC